MSLAPSIGTIVKATAKEASKETVTVIHKSLNICPVIPSTNKKGKNTAIVVKVDADIASATV